MISAAGRRIKVMRSCLAEVNAMTSRRSDLNILPTCVQSMRHKRYPAAPKDLTEVHNSNRQAGLCYCTKWTVRIGNNILLYTIVITWCNSNLRVLCRPDADIFADGTFRWYVNVFQQLYVIHQCVNQHYLPFVFCQLTGKSEQLCTHMWTNIWNRRTALGLAFKPIDFETAVFSKYIC
jgi:hypothetical protein